MSSKLQSRRNLSGIYIFDKLEGDEKSLPTCIEDCTHVTRDEWLQDLDKEALIRCVHQLCGDLRELGDLFDIYKE